MCRSVWSSVGGNGIMKTLVTMRVEFTKEEDADTLLEALADLESDRDVFPEGADIKKDYIYNA